MNTYTCPMHPEVEQEKEGRCPKCGMKLVPKEETSSQIHAMHQETPDEKGLGKLTWKNYIPLAVIIGLILLTALTISFRDFQLGTLSIPTTISYFMAGFFITFAGFKLMDLSGFAEGYFTYDLLAQKWFEYGYIYPFIELFFGLAMILSLNPAFVLWSELIVMIFSGVGVANKLLKGEKFQCVCLGTFLKVPLTKVTLVEDFGMAILAGILLLFR